MHGWVLPIDRYVVVQKPIDPCKQNKEKNYVQLYTHRK